MGSQTIQSGATEFGNFAQFCYEATIPACNIFLQSQSRASLGGCELKGIPLANGTYLRNLGTILLDGIAVFTSLYLLWRSERKEAAVGRREIQLFLLGFIAISICEIFSVGGIPLPKNVLLGFSAAHIAVIAATAWVLLINALVGFQLVDDGTPLSLGLTLLSSAAILIGTGYIALDTAFSWTGYFDVSLLPPNRNYGLYILYLFIPLLCIVVFFVLESVLVLRVLGEKKPMVYLVGAALLFALGQIFDFVISKYICSGTGGKIDGALFETLFTFLAVVLVWVFWSSITEDDWSVPSSAPTYP